MIIPRREFLRLGLGAAAFPLAPSVARAQAYPTKPVRLVVGFAAGNTADIIARLVGQRLSESLGQTFVIENRPGAGSNMGIEAVVRAAADGYTLLFITSTHAISASLYGNLKFNVVRDIAPVGSIGRVPTVMVVSPAVPAKTVPEFIAYAKANPGKLNMASTGTGNLTHVSGELFKMMTGVDMVHVPYRGAAAALTDLLAARAHVLFDTLPASIEHIRSGKLRPLAVNAMARSEVLPDVPLMSDFVPGYEAYGWYGIGAPKGTPTEIVGRLNKDLRAALNDPATRTRFSDLGSTPLAGSPTDFGKFIADEAAKWAKVISFAGIKPA